MEPRAVTNGFKKHGERDISNPEFSDSPSQQIIRLVDDNAELMRLYSCILYEGGDRCGDIQDCLILDIGSWWLSR